MIKPFEMICFLLAYQELVASLHQMQFMISYDIDC